MTEIKKLPKQAISNFNFERMMPKKESSKWK